ncbi:hypothetical protein B0T20DRAFT_404679 [Sordaria brevicollis]|uniref:Uncharacterized protein n=1 Tax=Sordaria brevicollis TaxID=83679 RepID=A0AAE0UDW7_SORBR|nr:hypothetical protein B0T20DRAFT_404679 [Sordaria brevicollis]
MFDIPVPKLIKVISSSLVPRKQRGEGRRIVHKHHQMFHHQNHQNLPSPTSPPPTTSTTQHPNPPSPSKGGPPFGFEPKPLNLNIWHGNRGWIPISLDLYLQWRTFLITLTDKSSPWTELTTYTCERHHLEDDFPDASPSSLREQKRKWIIARLGSIHEFETKKECEERERVAEEILTALGFRKREGVKGKRRGEGTLEMVWPEERKGEVADVSWLEDEYFWARFRKPAVAVAGEGEEEKEGVVRGMAESEPEPESDPSPVAGKEEEGARPMRQVYHGFTEDLVAVQGTGAAAAKLFAAMPTHNLLESDSDSDRY